MKLPESKRGPIPACAGLTPRKMMALTSVNRVCDNPDYTSTPCDLRYSS